MEVARCDPQGICGVVVSNEGSRSEGGGQRLDLCGAPDIGESDVHQGVVAVELLSDRGDDGRIKDRRVEPSASVVQRGGAIVDRQTPCGAEGAIDEIGKEETARARGSREFDQGEVGSHEKAPIEREEPSGRKKSRKGRGW